MNWKKTLESGTLIVLSTTNVDGSPHSNVVTSKGFIDDKLLINNCQMKTTIKNIQNNSSVCIIVQKNDEYYRIKGKTKIYSSGKYFEAAIKRNRPPPVKSAVVVDIIEVFDLDKLLKIF